MMLTLTSKNRVKVNKRLAQSAPESDPIHQIDETARQIQQTGAPGQGKIKDKRDHRQQKQAQKDAVGQWAPLLQEPPHHPGHIGHTRGKAPFVVIPGQHAHHAPTDDLGLIWRKDR